MIPNIIYLTIPFFSSLLYIHFTTFARLTCIHESNGQSDLLTRREKLFGFQLLHQS